jgi:hypothetical protein
LLDTRRFSSPWVGRAPMTTPVGMTKFRGEYRANASPYPDYRPKLLEQT